MTKHIFRDMIIMGMVILILCLSLFGLTMNNRFYERIYEEMHMEAELAMQGIAYGGTQYLSSLNLDNRITWIAADGTVLYDSMEFEDSTKNHLAREEVQQALQTGTGRSERFSESMQTDYLYYAVLADDGTVVRVSCEKSFVRSMMFAMLNHMIWLAAALILGSLLMALQMAKKITKPLNEISLDHPDENMVYPELRPLLRRIVEQNYTIGSQMHELIQREQEFAVITANMREGFVLFDQYGGVLSHNRSAAQLLRLQEGAGMQALAHTDFAPLDNAVKLALVGEHWEQNLAHQSSVFQCLVNPVISSGQVVGAVLFIMDVTEKQQREQLRREFSANVSHELKTPLTSISGFAELMMNGLIPQEKMPECAGDIYRQSKQLIALVGDIIKISKLDEQGNFETEQVDLYQLAQNVLERLRPAAMQQNLTMQLTGAAAAVIGVPQIIDDMIYNLCDNAVKYNVPGGRVTVDIQPGAEITSVTVTDTGIGIPYGEQERVFERFYRVDKSHSKEIGGTGLGLSIVKHGARYHDAEIHVRSAPGSGTCITLTFQNKGPA